MRYHYTEHTYTGLQAWAKKFATGDIHSLVIFGAAGQGKSETFQRALADDYLIYLAGRLTAFQLYKKLGEAPDALFVFDDTRKLLKDAECVNLLMQLAEHKAVKTIQWNTASTGGGNANNAVAAEIQTSSRMAILINRVSHENEDLEPIFSRSVQVLFAPAKTEVHRYVGEWFPKDRKSKDVYSFIGRHLHLVPQADIRDYTKSLTVYDMPWQDMLLQSWQQDEYLTAVMHIIADKSIPEGKAQVKAFAEMCGGSRDTLYRLKRMIQPMAYDTGGRGKT